MKHMVLTTFATCVATCVFCFVQMQPVRGQSFFSNELAGDLTVSFSPTLLLKCDRFQKLLVSDEWTKFYLAGMEKLDKTWLSAKDHSVFARQIEKTYAVTPPGMNAVFDTIFGNCQAVWLHSNLEPSTLLPGSGDPAVMFVTDFSPVETRRMLAAAFVTFGYTIQANQSDSVFALSKGNVLVWFIDTFAMGGIPGQNVFIIGRDPGRMTTQKTLFLRDEATLKGVNAKEGVFLDIRLTSAGLTRVHDYFKELPKDDAASVFAPGMIEVAKRTKEARLIAEHRNGQFAIELTLACNDEATAKDLAYFTEKSKEILAKWSGRDKARPFGRYGAFLLERSKSVAQSNHLSIRFEPTDEQDLQLLRECLTYWKKGLSP